MCIKFPVKVSVEKKFPEPAGLMALNAYREVCYAASNFRGDHTRVYLPDTMMKTYRKEDIVKFLGADETDKIVYSLEDMDCDDFARILFGKGLGLLWTDNHAINFFITPEKVLYYVEPQNDMVSVNLEGLDIRLFVGA